MLAKAFKSNTFHLSQHQFKDGRSFRMNFTRINSRQFGTIVTKIEAATRSKDLKSIIIAHQKDFRPQEFIACLGQAMKIPEADGFMPNLEKKLLKQLPRFTTQDALSVLRLCKQYQRSEPPQPHFPKEVIPNLPGDKLDVASLDELLSMSINYHLLKVYGDQNSSFEEMLVRGYQAKMLEILNQELTSIQDMITAAQQLQKLDQSGLVKQIINKMPTYVQQLSVDEYLILLQVCQDSKIDGDLFFKMLVKQKITEMTYEQIDKLLRLRVPQKYIEGVVSEIEQRQDQEDTGEDGVGGKMSVVQFINIAHGLAMHDVDSGVLKYNFQKLIEPNLPKLNPTILTNLLKLTHTDFIDDSLKGKILYRTKKLAYKDKQPKLETRVLMSLFGQKLNIIEPSPTEMTWYENQFLFWLKCNNFSYLRKTIDRKNEDRRMKKEKKAKEQQNKDSSGRQGSEQSTQPMELIFDEDNDDKIDNSMIAGAPISINQDNKVTTTSEEDNKNQQQLDKQNQTNQERRQRKESGIADLKLLSLLKPSHHTRLETPSIDSLTLAEQKLQSVQHYDVDDLKTLNLLKPQHYQLTHSKKYMSASSQMQSLYMMAYLNCLGHQQPRQVGKILDWKWETAVEHIQKMLKADRKWRFSEYDRLYFKGVFNWCQIIGVEPGFDFRGPVYTYPTFDDQLRKKFLKRDKDAVFHTQLMDVPIDVYLPKEKIAIRVPQINEQSKFQRFARYQLPGSLDLVTEAERQSQICPIQTRLLKEKRGVTLQLH